MKLKRLALKIPNGILSLMLILVVLVGVKTLRDMTLEAQVKTVYTNEAAERAKAAVVLVCRQALQSALEAAKTDEALPQKHGGVDSFFRYHAEKECI